MSRNLSSTAVVFGALRVKNNPLGMSNFASNQLSQPTELKSQVKCSRRDGQNVAEKNQNKR